MARYSVQTASGRTYSIELAPGEDIESVVAEIERSEGVAPAPAPSAGGGRGFVNPPLVGQPQPGLPAPIPAPIGPVGNPMGDDFAASIPAEYAPPNSRGLIQRAGEFLRPAPKNLLDQPYTPEEKQAEIDRRLSYGVGPIRPEVLQDADRLRSGERVGFISPANAARVSRAAAEMERRGEKTSSQVIQELNTPAYRNAAADYKAEEWRSAGEWAADTLSAVAQGVVTLPQLAANIVAPDSGLAASLRETQKELQAQESDVLKAQRDVLRRRIESEDGFFGKYWATVKELVSNPALSLSEAVKQVPMFLGVVGAARLGGAAGARGVTLAGRAAPTVALGEAISGGAISSAARVAGTTAGGAGASMVMAGGDAAGNTYEDLTDPKKTPLSEWRKNPDYQALVREKVDAGASQADASKEAIQEIATAKARMSALITAPLGLLGFMGAEAAVAARGLGRATKEALTSRGAAKMLLKENIGEQLEEGGTQLGSNLITGTVNTKKDLLEGVPEAMATAGVTSTPFAAAGAYSQYREAAAGTPRDLAVEDIASRLLSGEFSDPRNITPQETVKNFTPPDSPTKAAGLVDIVVPLPGAAEINPSTEQQFGLDKLRMGGVDVGTAGVPGGLAAAGGIGGGGLAGGSLGAAGPGVLAAAGGGDGVAQVLGAGDRPALPAGGAPGEQAAGVAVGGEPLTWTGRAKTGYANEQDAQQAMATASTVIDTRQTHDWRVEPMGNGRFQIVGYQKETNLGTQTPQAQQAQAPGAAATGQAAGLAQGGAGGITATARPAVELSDTERAGLRLAPTAPVRELKVMNEQLDKQLGVTFSPVRSADLTDSQRLASAVARLMGKTLTVVHQETGAGALPNGMINSLGGKHLFVADDADDAPLAVTVHEAYHGLPEQQRKALNTALLDLFRQDRKGEFLNEFSYTPDRFEEEAPAMMVQAISKREDFWQELRVKMGNKEFGEVAKVILAKLGDILTGAKKQYGEDFVNKYITDVAKARDLLTTAYADAMKAQGLQPDVEATSSTGGPVVASARSRIGMDFKDVIKRTPELQAAAAKVQAGEMTAAEYDRLVNEYKPVEPYTSVPPPATADEAIAALKKTNSEKEGSPTKDTYYGRAAQTLKAGDPVGLRLDIPSYSKTGTWVVTVHEPRKNLVAGGAGTRIGYESVASATDVQFSINEKGAIGIASGKEKNTIATMEGKWKPTTPAEAKLKADQALKSKDWVQVGMDPERHSYFYDRKTMEPVVSASEVIQIGPLVLAKNPTYGEKSEFMFSNRGGEQQGDWVGFPEESETLGIPRAEMPQIKGADRPELISFLNSRGIGSTRTEVPAASLRPTQAEFSPAKVRKWARAEGDRSVMISSDNYVLDGHHQWLASLASGSPVQVVRFNAPMQQLMPEVRQFPKVQQGEGSQNLEQMRGATGEQFTEALSGMAKEGVRVAPGGLILGPDAPPKDKPVVLVFGGSFNPVHAGHFMAAETARNWLIKAGYKVEKVVVSPSPQRLLKAKSGGEANSLGDRTAMAKREFAKASWADVTDQPSREADAFEGKLKRTQQAAWVQKRYPDSTVISLTGQDQVTGTGNPHGFPSVYAGAQGTSHEGYYYLAVPRDESEAGISSSKIRKRVDTDQAVPEDWVTPEVLRYFRALRGASAEVAIDGNLYDLDAPDFGLAKPALPLADGDPLLTPTNEKSEAIVTRPDGRQIRISRADLQQEIEDEQFLGIQPPSGRAPIVYIMGGGGAAGKGTVLRWMKSQGLVPQEGAVHIDPDKIKDGIPEYRALLNAKDTRAASVAHEESSSIAKRVQARAISGKYDMILDVTLGNVEKSQKMMRDLKAAGYEIRLFGVTIDPATAAVRAIKRATEPGPDQGRWVPLSELLKAHKAFTPAFEKYAELADQARLYDNTDGRVNLAEKVGGKLEINDREAYNRAVQRSEKVDPNAQTIRGIREGVAGLQQGGRAGRSDSGQPSTSGVRGEAGQDAGARDVGQGQRQAEGAGGRAQEAGAPGVGGSQVAFSNKVKKEEAKPEEPPKPESVGQYTYITDSRGRIVVSGDVARIRFLTRKLANATVVADGVRFKGEDKDVVLRALGDEPKVNPDIAKAVAEQLGLTPQELASTSLEFQTGMAGDRAFVAPLQGTIPEVIKFLEQRRRASGLQLLQINKPEHQAILAKLIAAETLAAIRASGNALEWYDETIAKTLAMAAVKYPELGTDVNAQMFFRVAMAITSQGLNVENNLNFTMRQYDAFRKQGKFPEVGEGEDAQAMKGNFALANDLLAEMGPDMLRRFLVTPFTVAELRSAGFSPEGELADEMVLGSSVFGPKIGFGFYSNLNGNFEPVTMDMWFMRTIGRLIGSLRAFSEKKFVEQMKRFRAALDERGTNGVFADQFDPALVERARTDNDAAIELARQVDKAHEKDYKINRAAFDAKTRKKSELVYSAGTMVTSLDKPKDAPANGGERRHLREIVRQAVGIVEQAYGQRIPPAAMQALIWYPEQELYKALGVKLSVTSQDYAGATQKVLLSEGYDAAKLRAAAESGSAGARRKNGQANAGGTQAAGQAAGQSGPLKGTERARFLRQRYERTELEKERVEPKRRGIVFEVAPDPNNERLTTAWRNLSQDQRREISERVAREIVPRVLKEFDTDGIITMQVGSYLDDTNPSFTLLIDKGNPVEIAKILGHVLAQDSMMVISPREMINGEKNSALVIDVGQKTAAEIEAIYNKLREIEVNGEKPVGGQSYANGGMTILNYSNVPTSELAVLVDQKLNKAYSILTRDVYAAFPSKQEYDYASAANDGRGSRKVLRQRARDLRAEATAAVEQELRDSGVQFSQRARYDEAGAGRDRVLGQGEVRGQVTPSYGTPRDGAASAVGYHYSTQPRTSLSSAMYGAGLRGAEMARLEGADPRLKQRIYFYIDRGTGVNPEAGVGGQAHRVNLQNLYDADEDALRLQRDAGSFNAFESAVIDAGFDGYMVRDAGPSGNAVLLGQHSVPVEQLGAQGRMRGERVAAARERVLSDVEKIANNKMLPAGQVSGTRWAELVSRAMPEVYERLADSPVWQSGKPMYRSELARSLRAQPVFSNRASFEAENIPLSRYTPRIRELPQVSPASALEEDIATGTRNLNQSIQTIRAKKDTPAKLVIGRMPHVMNMLGARTQDFDIAASIVWKVFSGKHRDEFPQVSAREFVEAMYRPAMIFKDKDGNPREFEMVLPITNENGALLMPIKVSVDNKDPIGAVLSLYNKRVSNDPKSKNEMTIIRRIQQGNLLYVDTMLAKQAMTGRPRGGKKDGVKLNENFLSWPGVWPTIEKLIQDRRVETDVDLMAWIGAKYDPTSSPRGMADAPAFSRRAVLAELRSAAETNGVVMKLSRLKKNEHAAAYWDHDGPEVWVKWLESSRKGAGAEAMSKLVAAADKTNTLLRANVADDNGSGGLFRYYERFGFERDPAGGDIIERPPVPLVRTEDKKVAGPARGLQDARAVSTEVPDQDVFEEFGRFAENRIDADRAWADGDHVFAVTEMDEEPVPVTSPQMLAAYTPDQLMIIRARDWSPSEQAAPDQAEVASLFRDLQDARGLGRVRALERVDAHPMAETIRRIDEEFMDILERLDDAGLVKINCK